MIRTYPHAESRYRGTRRNLPWRVFRSFYNPSPRWERSRMRRRLPRLLLEALEDRTLPSASILGSVYNDLPGSGVRQPSDPAVAGQVVDLHSAPITVTASSPKVGTTGTAAAALAPFLPVVASSDITVQNLTTPLVDVAVQMDLTNNSPDPVTLSLISPLGLEALGLPVLFTIQPGQTFNGTIDGNSSNPITLAPNLTQPDSTVTGTYAPLQSFSTTGNFIDVSGANGDWALVFTPPQAADIADLQLSEFSLTLTPAKLSTTTDGAGNYSFTGLAPGTYQVSLANSSADVVTSPAGGVASQTVTVADGQTLNGVDFGIRQPAPDVTSVYFALTSPATAWGQNVTVNYTLTNQGAGDTPAFDAGLYLSVNGDISTTSGPLLDTLQFGSLAAGASTSGSVTLTLPATAPAGFGSVSDSYLGFVIVDSVPDAGQSDKSNQGAGIDLALLGTQQNSAITSSSNVQQDPSVAVDPTNPNHLVAAYMDYSLVSTGYAGIAVAVSENGGQTWTTTSVPLPAGFNQGAAAPTVVFDAQGDVYISFMAATFLGTLPTITNLDPQSQLADGFSSNNGIFVAESTDGGLAWGAPVAVVSNVYTGTPVNFVSWPDMAVDTYPTLPNGSPNPSYGNLYVTWSQFYAPGQYPGDPSSTEGSSVMIAISSSHGNSWQTQMQNVPGTGPAAGLYSAIRDPNFATNDSGIQVRYSTVTTGPGQAVYISTYAAGNFTVYSSTDGGQSTGAPGNLVSGFTAPNYNNAAQTGFPFGTGFLVAVPGSLYGGLFGDSFRTLSLRQIVADPTRPGVLYALAPNDALDFGNPPLPGAEGVVFAVSYDYGQTWSSNFTVGDEAPIIPTLNANDDSTYFPVLNDDNDGQFQGFASSLNINDLAGQAMPQMTVDANGDIVVTWYDTRSDPAGHNLEVWSTVSTDGGLHWSANFPVSNTSFDPSAGAFTAADGTTTDYLGDQIGVAAAGDKAFAVWSDTRSGTQNIEFASYSLTPAPAQPTDRFSPNNTQQTATNLGAVSAQEEWTLLALPPGNSNEWFSVVATASGQLSVSVTAPANGQALQLTLTDADGNLLPATVTSVLDASGDVIGAALVFPSVAGQTYLIDVSAQSSTAIDYTLIAGTLTGDFGTQVQGSLSDTLTAGGQNLYGLTAAVTGDLVVTLTASADVTGDSGGAGLTLQILNANGQIVLESGPAAGAPAGQSEQIVLPVTQGEGLLFEVSGLDGSSQGDFTLQFTNLDQSETSGATTLFFPTQGDPSSIAAANLNANSNQMSLLVTNTDASDTLGVLQGNSDGTFQAEKQYAIGPGLSSGVLGAGLRQIAVANLTGSSTPDVIVPNFRAADVSVLLGNGDGTLQPQRNFDAVTSPSEVVTGDFNSDGDTDAIVLQNPNNGQPAEFSVLMGRGDGTFLPPVTYQTIFSLGSETMVLGDFTGNGVLDLIVFNANVAQGEIFYGNGDGTFRAGGTFATGEAVANAAAAYLTGDGNLDLITTGTNTGNVYVMLGNGDGTFQAPVAYTALAPKPGDFVGVPGLAVTNFGDSSPDGPLNIVVTAASRTGAGPAEVILLPGQGDGTFGAPEVLATVGSAGQIVAGDFTGDGTTDLAVTDKGGVTVIYGSPLTLEANTSTETARDLGNSPHLVTIPQAIVTGHEDAYFSYTVPTEAATGSGPEVIDFAAQFSAVQGAGLQMEVLDAAGNVLGSGSRFRIVADQGQQLYVHVFGAGSGATQGAGVYTLDIDVLPQVVSIQAESLVPGTGNQPGGPVNSLVITLQGDVLDPATAENPANYTVELVEPGGNNQVIPLATSTQAVLYDVQANPEVDTGLVYQTTAQQTITLLFDEPLPVGSYQIDLSSGIQTAAFNAGEAGLLGASGHPIVSVAEPNGFSNSPTIIEGSEHFALDLVQAAGAPGSFQAFSNGTPFLSQLQSDLSAQLNQLLASQTNDATITSTMIQQIVSRFAPALGPAGQRTSYLVLWLDPVDLDLADSQGKRVVYNTETNNVTQNLAKTFVEVGGNVEVLVVANAAGTFALNVADVPPTARGGAVLFGEDNIQTVGLTDGLQSGQDQFTFDFGEPALAESSPTSTAAVTSTTSLATLILVGLTPGTELTTGQQTALNLGAGVGTGEFGANSVSTGGAAPVIAGSGGTGAGGGFDGLFPIMAGVVTNIQDYTSRLASVIDAPLRDVTAAFNSLWGTVGGKDAALPQADVQGLTADFIDMLLEAGMEVYKKVDSGAGASKLAPLLKHRSQRKADATANPPKTGAAAPPAPAPAKGAAPTEGVGADQVLAPPLPAEASPAAESDIDFTDQAHGVLAAAVFAAGAWQGIWNAPSVVRVIRRKRQRPDLAE